MLIDGQGPGSDHQPAAAEEHRKWSREEEPAACSLQPLLPSSRIEGLPVDKMKIGFPPYFVIYFPKYRLWVHNSLASVENKIQVLVRLIVVDIHL